MENQTPKATTQEIEQAQRLLVLAGLPPELRLEYEGVLALGLETQVQELTKRLETLTAQKEAAYIEYKMTIQSALNEIKKTN